jgi:hypothetical protein
MDSRRDAADVNWPVIGYFAWGCFRYFCGPACTGYLLNQPLASPVKEQ